MFVVLMEVVHRIVVIPGSLLAGGMRGAGDDGALMHSPLGFSRPPHRRAGGPRTQVGSWVRSPLGFSRPPHLQAGGPRNQVGSWVRSPLGFSRPPHRRAGGLRI